MRLIIPEIEESLAGVYRIRFEDGNRYIGSSVDLKKRFQVWASSIKNRKGISEKMSPYLEKEGLIVFEVVEIVEDLLKLRKREGYHVLRAWDECYLIGIDAINTYTPSQGFCNEFLDYEKQKAKDFSHIWGNSIY